MSRPSKPWFRASKGTWYVTLNGKKVSLGVQGEDNRDEAIKAWHVLMAGRDQGQTQPEQEPSVAELIRQLLADREKPKPQGPTISEVIRQFLGNCEGRAKPNTVRVYSYFLLPFAEQHGEQNASELTPVLAESYARRESWSDSTRNALLGTLVTAFRWAVRKARLIPHSPLEGLERPPKASRGADALVTSEEHDGLMEAATPAFALFLRVLYATGARPGEVAKISSENFDPTLGIVTLHEHKMAHKGKRRVIHLTGEVMSLLSDSMRRFPTGPLLRNTKGKPWTTKSLVKAMIATRQRARIDGAMCYSYRHTFATDALAAGVPDAQVAELLGHSGTTMLHKHYSHLTAKARVLRSALDQVRP